MNIFEFITCAVMALWITVLFIIDIREYGIKSCLVPDGIVWLITMLYSAGALLIRGVDLI